MSIKLLKRVELAANLAIVGTTLLICTVLVKTFFLSPTTQTVGNLPVAEQTRVGETLSIPGLEWSGKGQTLVLALSSGCVYCTTSAPFYRRLAQERGGTRLIAVTPQEAGAARQYLEKLGFSVNEVRQASLESIGVQGTPTLLLVDANGLVIKEWIGKLPAEREAEVLYDLVSASAMSN